MGQEHDEDEEMDPEEVDKLIRDYKGFDVDMTTPMAAEETKVEKMWNDYMYKLETTPGPSLSKNDKIQMQRNLGTREYKYHV